MQQNANKNEMNSVILIGNSRSWKVKISKKVDQISSIDPTNWPQTGYQSKIEEIERSHCWGDDNLSASRIQKQILRNFRENEIRTRKNRWKSMNECTEQDEISGRVLFWLTADQLCLHFLAFGGRIFCHIWHCLHTKKTINDGAASDGEERIGKIEETARWQGRRL